MGSHSKKTRIRFSRPTKADAPALVGMTAAICLSPQAFAETSAPRVTAQHAAALGTPLPSR